MIPTRRLVLLSGIPLVLGAVAFWVEAAIAPMVAADVVLLVVAVADLAANRGAVAATRRVQEVQAVGRPFEVVLELRATGWRRLRARVMDDAPGPTRGLPASVALTPEPVEVRYRLAVPRRGAHRFGPVTVRFRSPLGLFEGQRRLDVPGRLRVFPDFRPLRQAGLPAREDERRLPTRVRRRPGGENEFERLRPYVSGDPYRHIDWRATARRRQLVSREYGQESNQNVILMLDAGRMMSARAGDLTAFDHALNAALMVGQTALRHGDRVGLLAFDREIRAWLPPASGSRNAARLIRATYDVFPSRHEPDYALAFRHLATRVRRRSLVVLFTSVVDEVNAALAEQLVGALARRHVPLCVWVRDPEVERLLHEPGVDPYVRGAAAALAAWRERALADLVHEGALIVDAEPERLTPELLARYLEIKARRRL